MAYLIKLLRKNLFFNKIRVLLSHKRGVLPFLINLTNLIGLDCRETLQAFSFLPLSEPYDKKEVVLLELFGQPLRL